MEDRGLINKANTKKEKRTRKIVTSQSDLNPVLKQIPTSTASQKTVAKKKNEVHPFYHASKTAKVSEHVLSKIKIIGSFIQQKEGTEKETINDYIDVILDHYLENELTEDEQQQFKQVYDFTTAAKRPDDEA